MESAIVKKTSMNFVKYFLSALMVFSLFLSSNIIPTTASQHNTPLADVGDVNVAIDSSGKLTVSGGGMNSTNSASAINGLIKKYRTIVVAVSGIGTVSMILFAIVLFVKLGKCGDNPQEKSKVVSGLITAGIATAGLGSVTVIVGFFFNALK